MPQVEQDGLPEQAVEGFDHFKERYAALLEDGETLKAQLETQRRELAAAERGLTAHQSRKEATLNRWFQETFESRPNLYTASFYFDEYGFDDIDKLEAMHARGEALLGIERACQAEPTLAMHVRTKAMQEGGRGHYVEYLGYAVEIGTVDQGRPILLEKEVVHDWEKRTIHDEFKMLHLVAQLPVRIESGGEGFDEEVWLTEPRISTREEGQQEEYLSLFSGGLWDNVAIEFFDSNGVLRQVSFPDRHSRGTNVVALGVDAIRHWLDKLNDTEGKPHDVKALALINEQVNAYLDAADQQ